MIALLQTKVLLKAGIVSVLPLAAAATPLAYQGALETQSAATQTVTIAPAEFSYRLAGDFSRGRTPENAPLVRLRRDAPLVMMKAQVSEAAFDRCVQEGGCRPTDRRAAPRHDVPVTGVNWEDATAYAQWLSAKTGVTWRLPTDEEWVFAAGSRATDDAIDATSNDFSTRWLAKYEKESARDRTADRAPRITGTFGANENGLLDLAGNVWEWTDTCFTRKRLDDNKRPMGEATVNCGVRVLQGAHRGYGSTFIRDPRGGGCSVGTPPDNLGFRLVRETPSWLDRMVARIVTQFARAA